MTYSGDSLKMSRHCFLDIWDLPIKDAGSDIDAPQSVAQLRDPSGLGAKIAGLTPQAEHIVRVFFEENRKRKSSEPDSRSLYDPPSAVPDRKGFKSLLAQLGADGSQWYQLDSIDSIMDATRFIAEVKRRLGTSD